MAAHSSFFTLEMLKAQVVTLPKPGKEPATPANFHPISLLNTDVKLYAKVLAKHLMEVLPTLIQKDQMGFVLGGQTSDAMHY